MMKSWKYGAIAALCLSASVGALRPAQATIVMVDASSIQGEELLFNSTVQGTTIQGHTNASTLVNFTGNTSLNNNVIVGTGGQAKIQGPDIPGPPSNDTYNLTNLSFSLATGTFNNLEFNINATQGVDSVVFTVVDNNNVTWTFNNLGAGFTLGSGQNFFGFQGISGETIQTFSMTFTGDDVVDVRQIRLDGAVGAVPEASTWAMLIVGFAGVGFLAYRRKSQGTALRLI